ncbi:hypothetical protein BC628DRAFT_1404309 [Trametes gibbosa]|nr:hypothetical protein BC628DRAFT_1404309 [Trametes gibbosa]
MATSSTFPQGRSNSNAEAVLQARLLIQSDIDVYLHAICDLKSRLNALTPIGSLPPELLSEILVCVAFAEYSSGYTYRTLSWIKASHICRLFRATALATPRFWSYLRVTKSRAVAELLPLSKTVPLHVATYMDYHSEVDDRSLALQNIVGHSHRLRELHFEGLTQGIQAFFSKNVPRLDILETLVLKTAGANTFYPGFGNLLAFVPTVPSKDVAPRLRYLELHQLPFRWSEFAHCSPSLTTLIVSTRQPTDSAYQLLPNAGTLEELFTAFEAIAPRLERLEIENTLPRSGLDIARTASGSPSTSQLPTPSRSISMPALKKFCLGGETLYVAHVLAHVALPSTVTLNINVRGYLGNRELMHSLLAKFPAENPLLLAEIMSLRLEPLTIFGWRCRGVRADASLRVAFLDHDRDALTHILHNSGPLFARAKDLRLNGLITFIKWAKLFAHFVSVETLSLNEHPFGDFFPALMTPHRLSDGRPYTSLPYLRVLTLQEFRFNLPRDGLEPFDELLDWTIFRCNYYLPIDKLVLSECRYASASHIERLRDVVVDVEWDEWERESTTEEEEESDEYPGSSEDSYFGYRYGYHEEY